MQTLEFNTQTKTVKFYPKDNSGQILNFNDVQTVSIREQGFYEVMQLQADSVIRPIFRVPISNTNMFLEH